VTGEGLLSRGDPIASIRCSVGDDASFFRITVAETEGQAVDSAVIYAVAVRLGMVGIEGLRLEGRVVGEGSSPGDVADTACGVLPSSQGNLFSVVPGASFIGRDVRVPGLSNTVMVKRQ
jgi:hypothetical protein